MSSAAATVSGGEHAAPASAKKRSKGKLVLLAIPVLLIAAAGGLWFTGVLPSMLGMGHPQGQQQAASPPVYAEVPDLIVNLSSAANRPAYLKLSLRLEVPGPQDVERVKQAMPRLQDLFQTYLREMRPDELRGSGGTYRLREELLARAKVAVAPGHVNNVLFIQLLIQ